MHRLYDAPQRPTMSPSQLLNEKPSTEEKKIKKKKNKRNKKKKKKKKEKKKKKKKKDTKKKKKKIKFPKRSHRPIFAPQKNRVWSNTSFVQFNLIDKRIILFPVEVNL